MNLVDLRLRILSRLPGELDKLQDQLQLTAHKLDHIRELILDHDRNRWEAKIEQLKRGDGEDWAIGETIGRILRIQDTENNR